MKLVSASVDYIQVFLIINSVGTKLNVDVNVRNKLTKVDVIKRFIWNPSSCECVCGEPCNVREYSRL